MSLDMRLGFHDPVDDAQCLFRVLLGAQAEPGRIMTVAAPAEIPPTPLGRAAIGIGLALLDFETPVWFDQAAEPAFAHLRFHCQCPLASSRADAVFAFIGAAAALPSLDGFALGCDAYPDRSTTLVIEVETLGLDGDLMLSGPGIPQRRSLSVGGLPRRLWVERAALAGLFPRGLDLIFTCGDRLAALPRTTRVEA
jgi:alpha-D-ribose 1-methylphosphonate 5-triphosphate synthase subunit PhnH